MKLKIDQGILIAEYPKNAQIDLDTAKQLVAQRLELQQGKTYPAMVHLNGVTSQSKAVRAYMAKEGIKGISRGAFIVKNLYEKVFISFFLLVDAPKVPSRVFQNEAEALKWLQSEIENNTEHSN